MTDRLVTRHHIDAVLALIDWFATQEVNPKDATIVCASLVGIVIGKHAKDEPSLREGVRRFGNLVEKLAISAFNDAEV